MSERDDLEEKARRRWALWLKGDRSDGSAWDMLSTFAGEHAAEVCERIARDCDIESRRVNAFPTVGTETERMVCRGAWSLAADLVRRVVAAPPAPAPSLPSSPSPEQASASPGEERADAIASLLLKIDALRASLTAKREANEALRRKTIEECAKRLDDHANDVWAKRANEWREAAALLRWLAAQPPANDTEQRPEAPQAALDEADRGRTSGHPETSERGSATPPASSRPAAPVPSEAESPSIRGCLGDLDLVGDDELPDEMTDADVLERAAEILEGRPGTRGSILMGALHGHARQLRAASPAAKPEELTATADRLMRFTVPSCEPSNEPPAAPASPAEGLDVFEVVAWEMDNCDHVALAALLRERFGGVIEWAARQACLNGSTPCEGTQCWPCVARGLAAAGGRGTIDAE